MFTAAAAVTLAPFTAFAQSQPAKRIYIVQSYEKGHVCGEPQAEGILDALAAGGWTIGKNLTVKSYYMDTYRVNATPEAMAREGKMRSTRSPHSNPTSCLSSTMLRFVS